MQRPPLMEFPDPEWIGLLKAEVAKGRSITDVAAEIDMPRPSLSLLLAGKYPAKIDKVGAKFAASVVRRYRGQVLCPHQRKGISAANCEAEASAPMSTSNTDRLSQWLACRKCPLNPTNHTQKQDA